MIRALALLSIPPVLALLAPACGSSTCGGQARSDDAGAPEVSSFFVLSEDRQIPGDPWTVLFGIDFLDPNGDLGESGAAEFYLNSNPEPTAQPLDRVFRQNGLQPSATEGAFWVTLRFAEATVDDGTRVRLGVQLIDGALLRSNCYTLDLEFDVFPASGRAPATPAWQVASRRCTNAGQS